MLVAPIDREVRSIDGDHGMLREQFAHPHKAQIGKIGLSIGIPVGETRELNKVFSAIKKPVLHCSSGRRTRVGQVGAR